MVSLTAVKASNELLATTLLNLVAIFVGGTSGIGEYSLKSFAKHTRQPRVYFIGRSQEAGDRIKAECQKLNPGGEFIFMKSDTSLIRNVDAVCNEIKKKEKSINILFMTTGTLSPTGKSVLLEDGLGYVLIFAAKTEEGLMTALSLAHYSRIRFTLNLLSLIQSAPALRRVVSVFCGTKEGPIDVNDLDYRHGPTFPPLAARGHASSLVTFGLEGLARQAPDVSFIHGFPGAVKSNIARDLKGFPYLMITGVYKVVGRWVYIPEEEVGERHLFLATSSKYASLKVEADGLELLNSVQVARGTDGNVGSGVYSIQQNCESAVPEVEKLLAGFRKEGIVEKVWAHTEAEFKRITG